MKCTLVGFSAELDWRPLNFVEPIAPNRVCSACGLVRTNTTLLPCTHVLCECYYEQCVNQGLFICPIDGYECEEEDVKWRECPAEELLRREVTCWNEQYGRDAVVPASEIFCHFHRKCCHHSLRCRKCLAIVFYSDICLHLSSHCSALLKALKCGEPVPPDCMHDEAFPTFFRAASEKQAAEIKAVLERVDVDDGRSMDETSSGTSAFNTTRKQELQQARADQNSFAETSRDLTVPIAEIKESLTTQRAVIFNLPEDIKSLIEGLKDELFAKTKEIEDRLARNAHAVEAALKKIRQMSSDKIKEVWQHTHLHVALSSFTIKCVEALHEKALNECYACFYGDKVYLRGYCISPGVDLEKDGPCMKLHGIFRLCKGAMDDILEWPFGRTVRLSVRHPRDGASLTLEEEVVSSRIPCQKPTSENQDYRLNRKSLNLTSFIDKGYAENDMLVVQWEFLP